MAPALGKAELQQAFDLLDRTSGVGGVRELTALSLRLDQWLSFDTPIREADGSLHAEMGHPLYEDHGTMLWILPGGELLRVPESPGAPSERMPLPDAGLDTVQLCDHLRTVLLAQYLGGLRLDEIEGALVPPVVADLLSIVWTLGPAGRATILRALSDAMHPGDGWDTAAVRLKSGFERGLGDRSEAVADVAARALVRIAAGLGPQPPTGDPARILVVLFTVPRPVVRVAALKGLVDLPDSSLEGIAEAAEPLVQTSLADTDAGVRRAASAVERRIHKGGEADAMAADLEAADAARRMAVLDRLARRPGRQFDVLLPLVLDAAGDADGAVRASALDALRAAMAHESDDLRRHVLFSLLESPEPDMVRTGLELLGEYRSLADERVMAALKVALDGPAENRVAVAEITAELHRAASVDEALVCYESFLLHQDPDVRRVGVRRLAAEGRERVQLREGLFQMLVEHLRDPEPELRVETALTIVELGFGHAGDIVKHLAFDSQPSVRHGIGYVLRQAGDPVAEAYAAQIAGHVDTLFDLASDGRGDARVRWAAALDAVSAEDSPRVSDLLAALLSVIPPDTSDAFLNFAIEEIDQRVLERTGGGEDLVSLCRSLMAPPAPQPEHAARLAGAAAAENPEALDFLWTLYTVSTGSASAAARRALTEMASRPRSPRVEAQLSKLAAHATDPAQADVLSALRHPGG